MTAAVAQLGDVASFIRGVTFKPDDVIHVDSEGAVACMRTKNIQEELDLADIWGLPERLVKRQDQFLISGDILVSSANSWNLVGKCCPIPQLPWRSTFGGFTSVLRPEPAKVDPRYLFRWFASDRIQATARSFGQQTTNISNLNIERCLKLAIHLPPLAQQRRIAEILDNADALRAKRRAALAQLDTLTQSIFLDMFGDPHGKGWLMTTIAGIAAGAVGIRTGPFGSQLLHSEFVDEGVAVLGIDNAVENEFRWMERRFITEAKYRKLSRYTVHPGDVIITLMGTYGRCAVVPDGAPLAINTKHLCCITVDRHKCLPEFLHSYFLRHPVAKGYLRKTAKGAIMDGLNMGIIREMPIPLAPLALQTCYAALMGQLSKTRDEARHSASQLDALFASLQHRAFRGEL